MNVPYLGYLSPLLIVGALAGLAALWGAWWLWWRLPKRQGDRFSIDDAKARADVEDNFRKTLSQVLLAAAALVGAALAYLQFAQQQQTSQRQFAAQQEASRQQFEQQQQVARDLLISNQVAKGFELLGNKDSLTQRLGGIYALEGVMKTSEQYHQPVLEALSAFVRDGTKTVTGAGPPATDIQAALTVIGRRRAIGERDGDPNLANVHIPNADLGGANLSGADLSGAILPGADLVNANLLGANLSGANLSHANLSGAVLINADLLGADLGGANLSGTTLVHINLTGADLCGANLSGGADLTGAIGLTQEQLERACGTDAKLDPGLTLKPCTGSK